MSPGRGVCGTVPSSCPSAMSFCQQLGVGCPIPQGRGTSLTGVFLLKLLGVEQSWSLLPVPKLSQSK